jgi:hypothetical protein
MSSRLVSVDRLQGRLRAAFYWNRRSGHDHPVVTFTLARPHDPLLQQAENVCRVSPGLVSAITAQMTLARSELWWRSGQRRVPKGRRRFPDVALPRP